MLDLANHKKTILIFSFLNVFIWGYSQKVVDLNVENKDLNVEDSLKMVNLDEVVVYAERNVVEDDGSKLTYNPKYDLTNTSVTTADVLRKTPMVSIDISGTPSLRGSQNVKVLINNREVSGLPSAQIIEQIPPEDIEKIEVITSPSARYEAEGTSGIINIITRKKIYFKSSGYANMGIGTKGSHLFANYSYSLNDKWTILNSFYSLISYSKTKSEISSKTEGSVFQKRTDGENDGGLYSYQLTLSKTSEKDAFNVYLNYYTQKLKLDERNEIVERQVDRACTENGYAFYKVAADYSRKLSDIIKMTIASNGFYLPINNEIKMDNLKGKYQYSIKNNTNNVDMEFLFSNKFSLIVGGKTVLNYFRNENAQTDISARQMNFAVYLDGTYKITNRLITSLGLRNETYVLKGWSDVDKKYIDFFFNANVNYKFDNKTTLSFLFSNRTQRPSYSALLPIESYASSNIVSVGNPNLNREMSYNWEVGLSKYVGEQFVKISPFYRRFSNKISNFYSLKNDILHASYININSEADFGISIWTSTNLFRKKLNINYGFDFIYKVLKYNDLKSKGSQVLNNLNITYRVVDDFYITFFGAFNTADVYLQGKRNSYTYSNLSIQKNLCKGNLRLAVSLDNPFNKSVKLTQKYHIENLAYSNKMMYYNRGIRLFAIYKFGKKQPDPIIKTQDDILKY